MMDDTSFFVGRGPDPHAVRDGIADIFGIDPQSILLAPALGYEWLPPDSYEGKTLMQWHTYANGDWVTELEIVLGGQRLQGVPVDDAWPILAKKLDTVVLLPLSETAGLNFSPTGAVSEVRVCFPQDYGDNGPYAATARKDV